MKNEKVIGCQRADKKKKFGRLSVTRNARKHYPKGYVEVKDKISCDKKKKSSKKVISKKKVTPIVKKKAKVRVYK